MLERLCASEPFILEPRLLGEVHEKDCVRDRNLQEELVFEMTEDFHESHCAISRRPTDAEDFFDVTIPAREAVPFVVREMRSPVFILLDDDGSATERNPL